MWRRRRKRRKGVVKMDREINAIKWALELCNQEGYQNTSEIEKAYNIEILGC